MGEVIFDPLPATADAFAGRQAEAAAQRRAWADLLHRPAMTRDGTRIAVHLNIADPAELKTLDPSHCDGIGLVRTEFLFHGRSSLPGEEAQFGVYRMMAEWAAGRPVTIRTLDAGGDKPIPGLTLEGESNPFLGLRGLRLSLRHPEVFRVQLRALLRASAYGTVKIMLPMVTTPAELVAARAMVEEEKIALRAAGRKLGDHALGIMVEVPAAAVAVDLFEADFYSIGSNDLTQYVTAAGRDSDVVADLADPLNPAVIRLVEHVARFGREAGREVSLCGDAGGDPAVLPTLVRAGLRSVSVAPAALGRTKAAIAALDLGPAA
jgi:phosphotransferase system enzyme I (PtsI)